MHWDGTLFVTRGGPLICVSLVRTDSLALDVTARASPWEAGRSLWVRRLGTSAFRVVHRVFLKLLEG